PPAPHRIPDNLKQHPRPNPSQPRQPCEIQKIIYPARTQFQLYPVSPKPPLSKGKHSHLRINQPKGQRALKLGSSPLHEPNFTPRKPEPRPYSCPAPATLASTPLRTNPPPPVSWLSPNQSSPGKPETIGANHRCPNSLPQESA